ncbi:WD40-repeat-containing domain protein [Limtongia smithiae]|uniref:WD40-repeat-containing domain protein n=1 Tax=Limtongia smithiae TaxID=1125753 RepID=UPI0034CF9832
MKTEFKFSNLLGTVYRQGNLVFTPDGTCLLSPVGNRVTCFDLVNNKSFTFSYEHRKNIARISLNPQATLLLSVDEDGRAILVNFIRRTVLYHFHFKDKVTDLSFSPDGKFFSVTCFRQIQLWRTPKYGTEDQQFAPFVRHRIYTGHSAEITSLTWSRDSRFFLTASKDLTARIYSVQSEDSSAASVLGGHRDDVTGAYFSKDQETIYTVTRDGALFTWKYGVPDFLKQEDEEDADEMDVDDSRMRWWTVRRDFFKQDAKVHCATFHADTNLLVVGFASGVFGIYELPDFNMIHTLSISQKSIDFVTINTSGEWLAFGAAKLGQLLVWEWQSESYILKQQGHYDSINCATYSPDGSKVITGSDDGKIKVWDVASGFAVVTFTEHISAVTALEFSKRGANSVLFSASLDGSIRAWDLIRYRNFRTFTAPSRIQFSSLAVDPSGEVVCAGSIDDFDIHLWSVQTGQLLDRLSGHEGPVSCLSFAEEGGILASASWDKTVRVWDIFARHVSVEPFEQQSDVLSIALRPDSKQVAVATLDGQISIWDIGNGRQVGVIDGRRDVSGGRYHDDRFTAKNAARSKNFRSLSYNADGTCILAAGNSRYICLYDVDNEVLLRKYTISRNMALEGTVDKLNSKDMTEAGPMQLIDDAGDASDLEDRIDRSLPGASRGDLSARKTRPAIRTTAIKFSPTGSSFVAASTEGLLMYSVDNEFFFDPFDLDVDVTPAAAIEAMQREHDYVKALVMAFRLNERYLIHRIYESVRTRDISLVARRVPVVYLSRLLKFIATMLDDSPHMEFHLRWIDAILTAHGMILKQHRVQFAPELRGLLKVVGKTYKDIAKLSDENSSLLTYILEEKGSLDSYDSMITVQA